MQRLRKCALVLCLLAAMTMNAATNRPLVGDSSQALPGDDIITLIIDFFVLHGRLSLPPG
ncbi:MAG TPA: hypothetical protein VEO54_03720 [Thermoanaerobaculia bacterium]|nr:hypothetical protein [Thermoanaerobaculia bacterium]